jgi:hypothetical protein
MKRSIVLIVALIGVFSSCNPVKKVLSTPKYFSEVKDTVLARGYCVNDTVFETIVDTVETVRDTFITDSFPVYTHSNCDIDTVFSENGIRLRITDGKAFLTKLFTLTDTKVITLEKAVVKDNAQAKVLKKEIEIRKVAEKALTQNVKDLKSTLLSFKIGIGAVIALILALFLLKR